MPRSLNPSPGKECCRASARTKALSYLVWNPKTRRVVESRNVTFIETPPHFIPQPTRPSPLRELPPAELVDDYASTDDLLRDARDCTAVLDFNVNIPAEHANADSVDGGPGMEQFSNTFVMLRGRTCSCRPANLRLGEPRPWKHYPGRHCRRHRRLLLRRTRCRRTTRQRQRPLRYH